MYNVVLLCAAKHSFFFFFFFYFLFGCVMQAPDFLSFHVANTDKKIFNGIVNAGRDSNTG